MLIGQDLSHHNPKSHMLQNSEFIWLKATEGKTYVDPELDSWLEHIARERQDNLPIMGFYHYARPENGNSAEAEAEHFFNTVRPHVGKCLLALDLEGEAFNVELSKLRSWTNRWLSHIHDKTGVTPFIYCGETQAKMLNGYIPENTPYWIARWNTSVKPLRCDIWQFTSKPFDMSIFYGSREELVSRALTL